MYGDLWILALFRNSSNWDTIVLNFYNYSLGYVRDNWFDINWPKQVVVLCISLDHWLTNITLRMSRRHSWRSHLRIYSSIKPSPRRWPWFIVMLALIKWVPTGKQLCQFYQRKGISAVSQCPVMSRCPMILARSAASITHLRWELIKEKFEEKIKKTRFQPRKK